VAQGYQQQAGYPPQGAQGGYGAAAPGYLQPQAAPGYQQPQAVPGYQQPQAAAGGYGQAAAAPGGYPFVDSAPAENKLGFFARLAAIVFSPYRLMRNVKLYPVVFPPILIVFLLTLAATPLTAKTAEVAQRELAEISIERYGADITSMQQQAQGASERQLGMIQNVTTVVSSVVIYPLADCLGALLLLVLTRVFRGNARFLQLFSALLHVSVVTVACAIFQYAMVWFTESMLNLASLAAIAMPSGNLGMPVYNLLAQVSLFTLWQAALVFLGVKALDDGFGAARSAAVTALYMAVVIGVGVLSASLTLFALDAAAAQFGLSAG